MDIDSDVSETDGCSVCVRVRESRRFPSAVRAVRQPLSTRAPRRRRRRRVGALTSNFVATFPVSSLKRQRGGRSRPAPVSRDPKGSAAKSDSCSSRQAKQDRRRRAAKPEEHQESQTGWTITPSPCCVCVCVFCFVVRV
jgi:hypothetical protein